MVQQNPVTNDRSRDVTPVAEQEFVKAIREREQVGIATYGVSLQTHNGRDAIQDAMEEVVDLWQYIVQIKMEAADLKQQLSIDRDELVEQIMGVVKAMTQAHPTLIDTTAWRTILRQRIEAIWEKVP